MRYFYSICIATLSLSCTAVMANNSPLQAERASAPYLTTVLDALKSSVDTRLPETAQQAAKRISQLIDEQKSAQALIELDKIEQQNTNNSGVNVQMMFLRARALATQGELTQAQAIYQQMTSLFPELAEPWNNLALIYVAQDQLGLAQDALQMALKVDYNYQDAKHNLAQVYLRLAQQSFQNSGDTQQAERIESLINP